MPTKVLNISTRKSPYGEVFVASDRFLLDTPIRMAAAAMALTLERAYLSIYNWPVFFGRQLFLLFLSFSLAVEALHSFMQDESEHKLVPRPDVQLQPHPSHRPEVR